MSEVSIVIPARNEKDSIAEIFKRVSDILNIHNITFQIIFVDSHSNDGSFEFASEFLDKYPLIVHRQENKLGKAGAILEGINLATSNYVVMIDGDLQYPPEAIPEMYSHREMTPVVVAKRSQYNESFTRRFFTVVFHFFFSKLLFGFDCDVQSGLKFFPRKLINSVDISYITPWTFDLALLYTAKALKMQIGSVPIVFEERKAGETKVNIWGSIKEHGVSCLKFKLNPPKIKQ